MAKYGMNVDTLHATYLHSLIIMERGQQCGFF